LDRGTGSSTYKFGFVPIPARRALQLINTALIHFVDMSGSSKLDLMAACNRASKCMLHQRQQAYGRPSCVAGMLAEQLGHLQDAEGHYEQHLALASTQEAHGPEWSAAFVNVMKVAVLQQLTFAALLFLIADCS